ncbi:N-terminal domain of NEFA-interacting nuclear protein NIP30-domain-containing protein [Xylaria bambusicola]|uniref:N-terminal domain of NEFA-interacting nuclear protein NIP30-domain-containing protein n=1 Tax=Xylaria bambusicola TaxID=326684 RepID=UPI002008BD65|nr:N-terminal domain of NEFA-interacting nuclear protein NIP30-domain-containing protein [Xylaria bambusicola]KAI0505468.1 N-terminal domain of NEFA-interacting nuclear protein NIP30-domain-containing protein [Xylaria bambusicola]
MTSRFVSGGIIAGDGDSSTPDAKGNSAEVTTNTTTIITTSGGGVNANANPNAKEWEAVQRDLDEERRRRAEARKRDVEGGGEKSLYEILQANKAAKQAAFEEANRIRNQFRALDDDEIEFLHGVSDEKRAEEERLRRETEEGLANFRKAQKLSGGGGGGGDDAVSADAEANGDGVVEEWSAAAAAAGSRKRKRDRDRAGLKGVKRRTSVPEEEKKDESVAREMNEVASDNQPTSASHAQPGSAAAAKASTQSASAVTSAMSKPKPPLGLVDYGSDEEDEDD